MRTFFIRSYWCGKKIIVYPRLGALSGVPFREVYKILRSTPYGRLRSCTSMYTPFDASRKITPDIGEPVFCRFKLRLFIAFAPIRCVSHGLRCSLHCYALLYRIVCFIIAPHNWPKNILFTRKIYLSKTISLPSLRHYTGFPPETDSRFAPVLP